MSDLEKSGDELDWGIEELPEEEPIRSGGPPQFRPTEVHDDVAATGPYAPEEYVPTSFEGWFNLGVGHLDGGDAPKAIQCFIKAVNFQHDHPEVASAYSNLGVAYEKLGQQRYALDAYRNALKANPGLVEARWGMIKIHLAQKQFIEAVGQLRQIPAGHPHHQLAQNQIKAILSQPQALHLWMAAVREAPDNPHLHFDLGQLYTLHHLPDRAIEHLRRVIELAPDHADAGALLEVTSLDQLEQKRD